MLVSIVASLVTLAGYAIKLHYTIAVRDEPFQHFVVPVNSLSQVYLDSKKVKGRV